MNRLTKFSRAIIAVVMMLAVCLPLSAQDFKVDGIYYNITDATAKTVEVGNNRYASTNYVSIPTAVSYNGTTYSVTSIGEFAFEYSKFTEISIPNSVTSIGSGAFFDCQGLTSVTIPNSVTSIGESAFEFCFKLTSITIPNSVTSIGSRAFFDCQGLTSVTIPNSVTSIGDSAFGDCDGLESIIVEPGNSMYDSRDNCNAIIETSTNTLIAGCKNTTIPNSVTTIGNYAFYSCTGLTSVAIPNSVTTIGNNAFSSCTGLTSVAIPNSVTTIGYATFAYCYGLTSVTIGNSVTTIGDEVFKYCTGLTSVTIGNSITSIGNYAFENCSELTEVIYNAENCTTMGSASKPVFSSCGKLTKIALGDKVKTIPDYAFRGCTGLTSVTIPHSVTSIGNSAFRGCTGLTSVTIGNSVTYICNSAFIDCGLRLIMCHCAMPPICAEGTFAGSYTALLMIPEGSLIDYALADEWHNFTQVHEVSEANVSTQKKSATFEIPTIEGADEYVASVYSDATMSQLVATTNYDAYGKITPMSTILELSIDGFDEGVYYYKVYVKSKKEGVLKVYLGTFEIELSGIEDIMVNESGVVEVERYDINGQLLNKPALGINIIKMSDGTTRKEWVK